MDLVQHPDGRTYRRVGSLDGPEREQADRLMARRSRADRKHLGLPVPAAADPSKLHCGHLVSLADEVAPGVSVCRACEFAARQP